jgi:hypothetical protein
MKSLQNFIQEKAKETAVDINKYYKKISDFKNGENVILAWIDEDGHAYPFNVIIKKTGSKVEFVNPDDENEVMDWKEFVNSTDDSFREEKNPQVAVANTVKEMQRFCDHYNDIADM